MEELTKRESQIAELVAWGASTKEIATRLFLSERTVENHIRNIHQKTGIQKATELSAWWFCKNHNIDPRLSPLKKMVVLFFLGLIISTEFTNAQTLRVFRSRTRIEARAGRRSKEDADGSEIDFTTF